MWERSVRHLPVLKSLGVLEGRRATCYPGVEDEMEDVVLTETAVVSRREYVLPARALALQLILD